MDKFHAKNRCISLVASAASMGDLRRLGRISIKIACYYLGTTAIAVGIGLVFANIFHPGMDLNLSTEALQAKEVSPPGIVQTFLNIIPLNPVQALARWLRRRPGPSPPRLLSFVLEPDASSVTS